MNNEWQKYKSMNSGLLYVCCALFFIHGSLAQETGIHAVQCRVVLVNQGHLLVSQVREHRLFLARPREEGRDE